MMVNIILAFADEANHYNFWKKKVSICKQHFLHVICVKVSIPRDYQALKSIVKLKYEI